MGRSERKRGIMPGEYVNPYASKRGSSGYDRRGRRIADELEAQVDSARAGVEGDTIFGQLPPNYADTEQDAGRTAEKFRAGAGFGSQGVTTSPNSGNVPTNWAQYETFLAKKGIELANNRTRTTGFESNDLPAGSEPITSTKIFQQDGIEFDSLYGGKLRQGDMTTPELKGLGTGQAENYRPGTYGVDPQSGASSVPDSSDQSRALEVDQAKNRGLPRGARQQEMFLRQNPSYGRPEAPEIEKGSGLSARSRAFLDYEGNSLNALRAADASQGIMRTRMIDGGAIGVKGADGEITEISREGLEAIRSGKRDQTEFSQDFLKQYMITPDKPADVQSNDSIAPKPATVDPTGEANPYQTNLYANQLQGDIGSTFIDKDREPLMRFPGIK